MKCRTFKLEMVEGGCRPGLEYARKTFDPAREYTLAEIIDMGTPIDLVAWMIANQVKRDASTMPLLVAWAKACASEFKLRKVQYDSVDACQAAIKAAMRAWAKGRPTSKGARQWAFSKLVDLIHSGKY